MIEVIKLINLRNLEKKIFTKEDILHIYSLLIQEFNVIFIEDIYFVEQGVEKYFMGYHLDNFKIHIDYDRIKVIDDVSKVNYEILFSIFHELRHAKQMEYSKKNNDVLAKIYNICFDYILNSNKQKSIYYHLYHSCFPIEINADLVAYIYLIGICDFLKDESYKDYYTSKFVERCHFSSNVNYEELIRVLLDDDMLNFVHDFLSSYDLAINGLFDSIKYGKKELNMLL